jgi:hypothetical protein
MCTSELAGAATSAADGKKVLHTYCREKGKRGVGVTTPVRGVNSLLSQQFMLAVIWRPIDAFEWIMDMTSMASREVTPCCSRLNKIYFMGEVF